MEALGQVTIGGEVVWIESAFLQTRSDDGRLAARRKLYLLKRRITDVSNNWREDVAMALDQPRGHRVERALLSG